MKKKQAMEAALAAREALAQEGEQGAQADKK